MAYFNRICLVDQYGHPYDSVQDIHGDYHMGVAAIQDINQDANNTSTANLASGATFTGTMTSIPGVGIINVCLRADQNCTVYVDQSGDGVNYDVVDTYYYVASSVLTNITYFGVPVQVAGQAYRVRVTNTGLSSTTVFRLESQLTPVGSPLPRSLDAYQNLKVGVYELSDQYGFIGTFDPQGRLSVAEPVRIVGSLFTPVVDTNFWTVANSGAGSVADTGATTPSYATLSSGTSNNGYGKIYSVRQTWFVPSVPMKFHSYVTMPVVTVANSTRSWGAFNISSTVTPQDGFYFSLNGSGVLSVNSVNGGSVNSIASGSFNGLVSAYVVDTNQHHYDIFFGAFGAYFLVDGILLHYIKPTTAPLISTFTLKASAFSANSASGTASATLQSSMLAISRLGKLENAPRSLYFSATNSTGGAAAKIGPGLVHKLVIANTASSSQIVLYDGTTNGTTITGTVLWDSGGIGSTTSPFYIDFGSMPFYTGLVFLLEGHAANVTLLYE